MGAGRLNLAVACLVLASCGPAPLAVDDVTFLVPLSRASAFLPASAVLPRARFDAVPPLTVVDEPEALYSALAVVGVRLDSCFREGAGAGLCQPQVRLVLQPVMWGAAGLTTRDAAVHLFFKTSPAEVLQAARSLQRARIAAKQGESEQVRVHPGFASSAFETSAREALMPLLTADRLVRVTSMQVHASNQAWIFSGTNLDGATATPISIATTAGAMEQHVTSTGGTSAPEVTLDPATAVEGALTTVIHQGGLAAATTAQLEAAAQAVTRLEDPTVHNPGTIDCATCHVAALTRQALSTRGVGTSANGPYADTRALRALGYFFEAPAISPRVQNESIAVRNRFNTLEK